MSLVATTEIPVAAGQSALDKSRWRPLAIVTCALAALVVVLYWPTLGLMISTWRTNATFSHCYFVPVLVAVLVWHYRERLAYIRPSPAYGGLVLVAAAVIVWGCAWLGYVKVVQEFAFIALLQAIVIVVLGWAFARAMLVPLLFMYFAVPFGVMLVAPLQDFTAAFVVHALQLTGIPFYSEGWVISVPGGNWEVAEACSGIRYLISSVLLGSCYVTLVFRGRVRRICVLAAFVIVPVLANALRAFGIVMLGYLSNNRLAVGVDHIIYGWVFFSAITFGLISLTSRWRETNLADTAHVSASPATAADVVAASNWSLRKLGTITAAAALLITVGPIIQARAARQQEASLHASPLQSTPPWTATSGALQGWMPKSHGAHGVITQRYSDGLRTVDTSAAFYSTLGGGLQITESWNQISDPTRWVRGKAHIRTITVDGNEIRANAHVISASNSRRLVVSWYWVDDQFTANAYRVKYLQARSRVTGGPTTAAVIAIAADFSDKESQAFAAIQDYLNHVALQEQLRIATGLSSSNHKNRVAELP